MDVEEIADGLSCKYNNDSGFIHYWVKDIIRDYFRYNLLEIVSS